MDNVPHKKTNTLGGILRRIGLLIVAAMGVGAAIYTIAWFARDYTFIGDIADQSRDAALVLRADNEPPRHLHAPLIFVNIDDATYSALGHRDVVPAAAIEKILAPIAKVRPKLIVLDIDISARREPEDVRILSRTLSAVRDTGIPLFLVRSTPPHVSASVPVFLAATPYDALMSNSSITWASGEALVSQGITRGVSSLVLVCANGTPSLLPGLAPLTSQAYYGGPRTVPEPYPPKPDWTCSGKSPAFSQQHFALRVPSFDHASVALTGDRDRLVHFTLRWKGPEWTSSQVVQRDDGTKRPLLSVLPALRVIANGTAAIAETGDLFEGAIVIVGASNIAAGDNQSTPLGDMPGAMVLLNHIRGILDFGPEGREQFLPGLLIMLVMSAVTGFFVAMFSRWTSSWGGIALPVVFTLMWWGATALLLGGTGYFALPLVQFLVGIASAVLYPNNQKVTNGGH